MARGFLVVEVTNASVVMSVEVWHGFMAFTKAWRCTKDDRIRPHMEMLAFVFLSCSKIRFSGWGLELEPGVSLARIMGLGSPLGGGDGYCVVLKSVFKAFGLVENNARIKI
ncbi:hypothetical protein JCGZ_19793 [Jatropha curcas]|uniref:Uncharacterized protein n=1 Tax=Jatropha curcas TaxID=180498 RepID=A0A067JVN2_JATCU|nr:hypothetical protein JCGZ_19793 [Jatropha curcas]